MKGALAREVVRPAPIHVHIACGAAITLDNSVVPLRNRIVLVHPLHLATAR